MRRLFTGFAGKFPSSYCMRVLLYGKMIKEAETEKTSFFFCHIFIISNISIGGAGSLALLATPPSTTHVKL